MIVGARFDGAGGLGAFDRDCFGVDVWRVRMQRLSVC